MDFKEVDPTLGNLCPQSEGKVGVLRARSESYSLI